MTGVVAALALALALSGCYKATFVRDVEPVGSVHDEWVSFFLFGLVGVHDIDVREYCPGGAIRIMRTGGNISTGLVTALSLGIYSPRKVWIQCGAAGGADGPRPGDAQVEEGGAP